MYSLNYSDVESQVVADSVIFLSAISISILQSALSSVSYRRAWDYNGLELMDAQWDTLDSQIAIASGELMASMVGMIMPIITSAIPNGTLLCDGSIYNKIDYPALYDVLDSQFIVSSTQFRVPDLTGKFLYGSNSVGTTGGSETHTLSVNEIPPHTHTTQYPSVGVDFEGAGVPDMTAVGNPPIGIYQSSSVGGGQAHNNMPPYFTVRYVVTI